MSTLLSLPNELLQQVFLVLPNVQDASHLGSCNRRLQTIWTAGPEQEAILHSILERNISAYKEALNFLILDTTQSYSTLKDSGLSLKALLPALRRNAKMCAKVCTAWHDPFEQNPETAKPWNTEIAARDYYRTRSIALAHDHKQLRRPMRRKVKALPWGERHDLKCFVIWWVLDLRDVEIRQWHGMGKIEEDCESDDDHESRYCTPMRWSFAVETVILIHTRGNRRIFTPYDNMYCYTTGKEGFWSNRCGVDYHASWW